VACRGSSASRRGARPRARRPAATPPRRRSRQRRRAATRRAPSAGPRGGVHPSLPTIRHRSGVPAPSTSRTSFRSLSAMLIRRSRFAPVRREHERRRARVGRSRTARAAAAAPAAPSRRP
jgi:hypothetical protein